MRTPLRALAAAAALTLAAGAARAEGELHLFNWSNYYPPELMERFEKETGIKVSLDIYSSDEDMMAKLQAGASGYDIVFPSAATVKIMIDEGMAEKIDAYKMPNFKNVAAPHDSFQYDPKREYTAPYMWGTTGLSYDSARVPGGQLEESWKEFFEPRPELAGQIAALDDVRDVYNAAAYYLGIDKCTEDPAEAQKILDLLLAQKEKLKLYSSDGTIDRMIAGEVIMHQQWNGAAHRARKQLPTLVYVYPQEGTSFWADNLMVPKGAPNLENAKTFINWMMEPEIGAIVSNYTGYMNSLEGSDQWLDETLKQDPAVNMPPEYAERLVSSKLCSPAGRELRDKVWTRLKK